MSLRPEDREDSGREICPCQDPLLFSPGRYEEEHGEVRFHKLPGGYSYLHSGYTADYEVGDKKFKIFVIKGKDAGNCHGMMEK